MKYMGITNEETVARSAKEGSYSYADPRRGGTLGDKSEGIKNQQERVDREDCQGQSIFRSGTTPAGGMLRQLIRDYRDQVARKEYEIQRHKDEIKKLDAEKVSLESRIREFELLHQQVEEQSKQNE